MKLKIRRSARVTVSRRRPNQNRSALNRTAHMLRRVVANQLQASLSNYEGQLVAFLGQTIQKEFAEYGTKIISQLEPIVRNIVREELNETVPGIVQTSLVNELYSEKFAQFLQATLSLNSNFGEIALPFLQHNVILITTGGTITGMLVEIGTNNVRIQESDNSEVLVPFRNAISINVQ